MSVIVGPHGETFRWGALTATSGKWLYQGGLENATTTGGGESLTWFYLARDGILRNLFVVAGAATTVTIRLRGVNTALTLSVLANTVTSDLITQVAAKQGDWISVAVGGTAGSDCRVSVEYV